MFFWWYMFVCNLIYPLAMIGGGWLMWRHCPKSRNRWLGYRTRSSMVSEASWRFANEDCGRRWWRLGWLLLVPIILVQIPFYGASDKVVGVVGIVICVVGCTVLLGSLFPTEMALKRKFGS